MMTDPANPEKPSTANLSSQLIKPAKTRLWQVWLWGGSLLCIGLGSSLVYGWISLQRHLTPLIESELENFLNRPVELGSLQFLWWDRLRFGSSEILSTPTDPAHVSLKALEISYNPFKWLLDRKLPLSFTAIEPDLYLEQGKNGYWLLTEFDRLHPDYPISLNSIRFQNAKAIVVARSSQGTLQPSVTVEGTSGYANLLNQGQQIRFWLDGELAKGGDFSLKGIGKPISEQLNLTVTGNRLFAIDIGFLVTLPLSVVSGHLDANLDIQLQRHQLPQLHGTATLNQVTARVAALPQPITQAGGDLHFKGTKINTSTINGYFAKISTKVNGSIDLHDGYALNVQTAPTAIAQAISSLKLKPPTITLVGDIQASVDIGGSFQKPDIALNLMAVKALTVDRLPLRAFNAQLQLHSSYLTINQFKAIPAIGGELTGTGNITLNKTQPSNFALNILGKNLSAAAIAHLYQKPLPIDLKQVSGQMQLSGTFNRPDALQIKGSANIPFGGGTLEAKDFQYAAKRWQGTLVASDVSLASLTPSVPRSVRQGRIEGVWQVAGGRDNVQASGRGQMQLAGGKLTAQKMQLTGSQWKAKIGVEGLNVGKLLPELPQPLQGQLNGNFDLTGKLTPSLADMQGQGTAKLVLAEGAIAVEQLSFNQGRVRATLLPQSVALQPISADLAGKLDGKLTVSGPLDRFKPADWQANGQLAFSQGIAAFNRPLTAVLAWNGQRLSVDRATAPGLTAQGWAKVNWSHLCQSDNKLKGIEQFSFKIATQNLDLKSLPIPLPAQAANLDYAGKIDFAGQIAGTFQTPNINGQVALQQFRVEDVNFEPLLTGEIHKDLKNKLNLQLSGENDRLHLQLDRQAQPIAFTLKRDRLQVKGSRQENLFNIETEQIPVDLIKKIANHVSFPAPSHPHVPAFLLHLLDQPYSGDLSGQFLWDVKTNQVLGQQVTVAQPRWGRLKGEQFTGDFQYNNGHLKLKNGQFYTKKTQYQLNGNLALTPNGPRLQAEVAIARGQVQDVLETLQIYELSDFKGGLQSPTYHPATDLYPQESDGTSQPLIEVGSPKSGLEEQLRYFADFNAKLQEQQQKRPLASPLPQLQELEGGFDGKFALTLTPESGIDIAFNLQGQNWQWGKFAIDRFQARGNWQKGTLTLDPLNVQAGETKLAFMGSLGDLAQTGQLDLVNFPLQSLSTAFPLPPNLTVAGLLNASVTLGGSRQNPQAVGRLLVEDTTLNQISLQATTGEFTYHDGRLQFTASSHLDRSTEPLTVEGTFPYQLPFASVQPDSDHLAFRLNLSNDGLKLLNLVSKGQLNWIDGKGDVHLDISGEFDSQKGVPRQLHAEGVALIENATMTAQIVPQAPFTQVNGKIRFDFDRLEVERLTGQFSGGQVAISGALPLIDPTPQPQPLTLHFDDLALNLPDLYRGGVKGELTLTGTVLAPDIGGNVELFDGQILLGESLQQRRTFASVTEFNHLKLTLGEKIQITHTPVLSFLATGSLILNGTPAQPRLEGTITLESGLVNLFASQLRLAGGQGNTAQFFPHRGLDPYLNVRLFTSTTEVNRNTTTTTPLSSEVNVPFSANVDSLQTVRIQAQVKGFASQLTNSIELTSTPKRSPVEIVTMLGGNFVNSFGRGETTLGLANLAGTAVLGPVQGAIGEALGLSEFRIFPTQLSSEQDPIQSSQIGVAAEAGIDLTQNLSLSVQKIVNTDRPPQLGIRYRINENTVIRGSSNFADDSRGSIEFEQQF